VSKVKKATRAIVRPVSTVATAKQVKRLTLLDAKWSHTNVFRKVNV